MFSSKALWGLIVAISSTTIFANQITMVADTNTPDPNQEITVWVKTDTPLFAMGVGIYVTGDEVITSAMCEADCNNYGWDNGWDSDPYIDPNNTWLYIGSVRWAADANGTVGYFKLRYHSGQVTAYFDQENSYSFAWNQASDTCPIVPCSTDVLTIGTPDPNSDDSNDTMFDSMPGQQSMYSSSSSQGGTSFYCYPDFNFDRNINFRDFAVFAANWKATGTALKGDFDGSGTVDFKDLANFAYFWLQSVSHRTIYVPNVATTIQSAIEAAITNGDTVVLAKGTYHEHIKLDRSNITLRSMDPNDPNCVAQTIIQGDNTDTTVDMQYTASTVSGLTITNGYPAVYQASYSSILDKCVIRNNPYSGMQSVANTSGIHPIVRNCTFRNNGYYGITAQITSDASASITLTDCNMLSNSQAGIYVSTNNGYISIANCRSLNNSRGADLTTSYLDVTNSIFAKNTNEGIKIEGTGAKMSFTNCTIYQNSKGISATNLSSAPILNSIIWDNPVGGSNNLVYDANAKYCCFNQQIAGVGNIYNLNPHFKNADGNDFHVDPNLSPCVDAGAPWSNYSNEPAPNGSRINMGAYGNTSQAECTIDRDGDGLSDGWEKAYWPSDDPNKHNPSDRTSANVFTVYTDYLFGYSPVTSNSDSSTIKYAAVSPVLLDITQGGSVSVACWVNRATTLTLTVKEKISNTVVYSSISSASVGCTTFNWNCKDANGLTVNDSNYIVTVGANDSNSHTDSFYAGNMGITYAQKVSNVKCNPYQIVPSNNETTTISYDLSCAGNINIDIYDPSGRKFASVITGVARAVGHNSQDIWFGKSSSNKCPAVEGTYKVVVSYQGMEEQSQGTVKIYK